MIKRCTRKNESEVIWVLAFLPRALARGFPARDSDESAPQKKGQHFADPFHATYSKSTD